jgi:hypothetical protein
MEISVYPFQHATPITRKQQELLQHMTADIPMLYCIYKSVVRALLKDQRLPLETEDQRRTKDCQLHQTADYRYSPVLFITRGPFIA